MATRIAGLVPAWITITGIWKAFDVILGPYVDTKNCAMPCWMLLIRARLKKSCKPCKRLIPHAVHWKQGHKTSDALPFISRGPKPMQRERARVNAMVARAQVSTCTSCSVEFLAYGKPFISFWAPVLTQKPGWKSHVLQAAHSTCRCSQRTVLCHDAECS